MKENQNNTCENCNPFFNRIIDSHTKAEFIIVPFDFEEKDINNGCVFVREKELDSSLAWPDDFWTDVSGKTLREIIIAAYQSGYSHAIEAYKDLKSRISDSLDN